MRISLVYTEQVATISKYYGTSEPEIKFTVYFSESDVYDLRVSL